MNSSVWQQVFEIFEQAVELSDDERSAFLDSACDDQTIRRAVEDMLDADREEGAMIIDRPVDKESLDSETLAKEGGRGRPAADPGKVGAYRLLRRIGQGGMSTVYLAVRDDDAFRRHVAVKLVRRGMESDAILQRLRTERQILASLDHPYVARLYDGGSTEEGMPYFVIEHVDGTPIDAYCEHNQLSVDQRLTLFRKVCAAVRYAHQNLVVHRDIKPSNILVTADGSPKLLDFGIAKLLNPDLTPSEADPDRDLAEDDDSELCQPGADARQAHHHRERCLFPRRPALQAVERPAAAQLQRTFAQRNRTAALDHRSCAAEHRGHPAGESRPGLDRPHRGLTRAPFGARSRAGEDTGAAAGRRPRCDRSQERNQKEIEKDKKQQVLSLILDIFEFSNPYVLAGEDLTVREALRRSVPVLEAGLHRQPDVRAELLFTSGSILAALEDHGVAKSQIEESLEIRRSLHGDLHADVVDTIRVLASIRKNLGDLDAAEDLARQSIELARALGQEAEPLLVESFQQLLTKAEQRHRRDAFERLRDHLKRCDRSKDIARYEAMLADEAADPAS